MVIAAIMPFMSELPVAFSKQPSRQQPRGAGVLLQPVLQRDFGAQLAVKGRQHRQTAAAEPLWLIRYGEKLKERLGGAQLVHAGNLIKPLHDYPPVRSAVAP